MPRVITLWSIFGILVLAACASTQTKETMSFENTLDKSGFVMKPADTPEKLAQLEKMPQKKLVKQDYKGQPVYLYADAAGCKCLYAGSEEDYESLQRLIDQQKVADEERASLDQAPPYTDPKYVDVEAYGGTDPLPWW